MLRSASVNEAPTPTGRSSSWRLYAAIGVVILTAIFILQNSQKVKVDFIVAETETPLIFALLLAAVLGLVIGLALPRLRRPHD
jgi:uncharacterized integral membrane protein